MVITPVLEKPENACSGDSTPASSNTTKPATSTTSAAIRVVASRISTDNRTISVNQASQIKAGGSRIDNGCSLSCSLTDQDRPTSGVARCARGVEPRQIIGPVVF